MAIRTKTDSQQETAQKKKREPRRAPDRDLPDQPAACREPATSSRIPSQPLLME